jgi:two-component sensor histidine kinase
VPAASPRRPGADSTILMRMSAAAVPAKPRGLALVFGWRRLRFTLLFASAIGFLMSHGWQSGLGSILGRTILLGLIGMTVFGLFEQWPRRLPRWIPRWMLQVIGVGIAMPISTVAIYIASTDHGAPPFWEVEDRMQGFGFLTGMSIFLAPWCALGALVRQREAFAREQALAFDLERSEYERQALDARLNLLQAQVAPHFLFNTLANVQALVDAGSPQASDVLRSLVAYLRAAVPRINEAATTLGQELQLVRAYLELMHMRMPDRLRFDVQADESVHALRCPPMTILTLVENAVRHGIDPSEEGGRIEIRVERRDDRCIVRVSDTGVGLRTSGGGLGTGLATLRERLQLIFGNEATLRVSALRPHGALAEIEFPARTAAA